MGDKFKEIKNVDFPKIELEILDFWKKNKIFEKSVSTREDGIPFTFYEGPPTANGKPGIHHVLARTVKDMFCRYKTIKGYRVNRKAGWDTHGLPVEIEVEKQLGLKGRAQVEEYGIDKYNQLCKESVLKYKDLWDDLTTRMGYWVDLKDPYITFENNYIESVWWALKQLYDKDLLYKGYKIQWYSPGSGTVLSSHEVSLGYEEVQDPSVYIKFRLDEAEDTYFLAWTTTPWTLISNMLLAVNPKLTYVLIRVKNEESKADEHLILVKNRLEVISGEYEVLKEMQGEELLGKTYKPVFDYALNEYGKDKAWRVVSADFVTTEDGTGVVHLAPAFGADDYDVCKKEGVPLFNPVTKDGTFEDYIEEYSGLWFKDADKPISRNLRERGLLYKHETYLHNYPHDWRKGTPLMSYPVESWFIRTTKFKDRMIELNKTINWKPESTGTGRFGTWLENNIDWAISRQRYWGTPLPVWVNDKNPSDIVFVGSVQELREKAGISKEEELDLHRPHIDSISWKASDGGTYRRVTDLVDVWLDSGAMPFCQWHYPFENNHKFKENFPADFIAEGVDQTRGWFYTLHALSTMLFDKPAYMNVISNGLVLDAKGDKMSKSKGNTVDPFEVIRVHGADTVRWYMMSNTSPWENLKFSEDGLKETQRKFFNTIMNTYSFLAMYANIDGWKFAGTRIPVAERSEMDRWIISRMFTTIKEVDGYLESYEPTKAAREIEEFVEDLSNWYIRRNRRRFWKSGKSLDKTSAYQTLFECLFNLSKLMSPMAPFFSDWLYRELNEVVKIDEKSVHLSFYPTVEETSIDKALEYRMGQARIISSTVLRIRNKIGINVRQPLAKIILPIHSDEHRAAVERVKGIILDEVNVKNLEYAEDDSGIVHKSAKPNFPVLGSRLGKKMKAAAACISSLSNEQINTFERSGSISLDVDGEAFNFQKNDIIIVRDGLKGWEVETEDGITVAADTNLTPDLIQEGLAREIINRVQNMRKEADFDVTDRIRLVITGDDEVELAVKALASYIMQETLSEQIFHEAQGEDDYVKEWDIDGKQVEIAVKRKPN
ncbi:MAG: isoleucine--tRNA ligase [Balneolales bacterium]|nr:isoleucine--tRNA ligase [Balneolales bacterium]